MDGGAHHYVGRFMDAACGKRRKEMGDGELDGGKQGDGGNSGSGQGIALRSKFAAFLKKACSLSLAPPLLPPFPPIAL